MRNYWPVMGVFYLDSSLLHFLTVFDRDFCFANLHFPPFAIVTILARIIRIQFLFENI